MTDDEAQLSCKTTGSANISQSYGDKCKKFARTRSWLKDSVYRTNAGITPNAESIQLAIPGEQEEMSIQVLYKQLHCLVTRECQL